MPQNNIGPTGTSQLFCPYKAIGYVTDGNPFSINRLGNETFLTTSIGKSFQVYKLDHLRVSLVSKITNDNITCIETSGHETYVAVKNDIIVYNRNDIVRTYKKHKSNILGLLIVGNILLSYDIDNYLVIIDINERSIIDNIHLIQNSTITSIIHPDTYINKFLIGYANGNIELWNIRSNKRIHNFTSHINYFKQYDSEYICPSISCMEQSPAYDIIALGFESGDILLINLKLDKVLFSFKQDEGTVTSLTFRTDSGAEKFPYMISGTNDGRLHVWNLGTPSSNVNENIVLNDYKMNSRTNLERKLQSTVDDAHLASVSKVHFLHGEPIMISSSLDNSIKIWIFDNPDGTMRLLRSREGHTGNPLKIRYYGARTNSTMRENTQATNCEVVSAGSDGTIRLFNTAIESQNREMSQRRILDTLGMRRRNQKLPIAIGFDFSETRQKEWGNMVTIHKNHINAYVWRYKDKAATDMILRPPDSKKKSGDFSSGDHMKHSTSVCVSLCGHFCLVGSKGGNIHKYNLQSGIHRGTYPQGPNRSLDPNIKRKSATPGNIFHEHKVITEIGKTGTKSNINSNLHIAEDEIEEGHNLDVNGLFIDLTNSVMVSCGLDGMIMFWDFQNHKLLHKVSHNTPQLLLHGFRDSNYVAIAGQDRILRVYDITTYKLSRRFDGHSREITDLAFTPDGRQLLSSSVDSTLRVWDLATGRCLSWLLFDSPILTMAMSLSGEYLCVGQADKEGIYMYADRSLYETLHLWKEQTSPIPISDSLVRVDEGLNSAQSYNDENKSEPDKSTQSTQKLSESIWKESSEPRGEGAITMSLTSRAYWTTLFNLETIKERNKADAAPILPASVPFFLPSTMNTGPSDNQNDKSMKSNRLPDKKRKNEENNAEDIMIASNWDNGDEDDEDDNFYSGHSSRILSINEKKKSKHEELIVNVDGSKATNQKLMVKRCKLVGFIFQEYPNCNPAEEISKEGRILNYLKSLTPPAVDIEIRSLCRHENDDDGITLLHCIIDWLQRNLQKGENFDVLQAYLHRTLTIHSEILLKVPSLISALTKLKNVHKSSCDRFRNIIQQNLCIVQLYSNIKAL